MKLAAVVQRYGLDVSGGAELHARFIAERLARHAEMEVLTTCARDYVTWRNEYPAGVERINDVPVRRFPVHRPRNVAEFGRRSRFVFGRRHSLADELAWLDSEGPASPALVEFIRSRQHDYDYLIFFSYRYYHSYHGARAAPGRAVLVPTAERDEALGLAIFQPLFRSVRTVMYNSFEERALIQAASGNHAVPGVVVGVGSSVPEAADADRFRRRHQIDAPYVLYVGRIDENKGCRELFDFFLRYAAVTPRGLDLVVIGKSLLPVPAHPRVRHLGHVTDEEKFDAIAGTRALIMPSHFESLSMVTLEAWALGRPVLANGRCDVLRGQCIRSNAGLYYESLPEFLETLHALEANRLLNEALGANGRAYYRRHYAWPVIDRKYLEMIDRLRTEDGAGRTPQVIEPEPGWVERHRRTLPPAAEVVDALPSGPVLTGGRRGRGGRAA